jgi:HK97 family phage portal protein
MKLWPWSRKANDDGSIRRSVDLFNSLFGWLSTKSGASVNTTTALEVTAVLACVRVIAEGIAQVPLKLFREDGRNIAPATEHPLYRLLHRKPNPWMSSYELRETLAIHAALTGNAVSYLNRVPGTGRILEITPFRPNDVQIKRDDNGQPSYTVTAPDGSRRDIPRTHIWHIRGPSWDGIAGLEIIKYAREAIGLAMATEEAHAGLHKNGARVSGVYSVEGNLTLEQHKQLSAWIEKSYAGTANAGRIMLMDRAAKFTPQSMTGVDAQHLETRRFQIEEICRAFRVQPIMAGYSDKTATYASVEQMLIAHVVHTLAPWYERIEQSIDCQLLSDKDMERGYYAKFIAEGLMRGAFKDTAESLTKLTTNGILTRNEARAKLEYNPIAGLDQPLTPINLTGDPDQARANEAAAKADASAEDRNVTHHLLAALADRPAPDVKNYLTFQPAAIDVKAGDTHVTLPEGCIKNEVSIAAPEIKTGDTHITLPEGCIQLEANIAPPEVKLGDTIVTLPAPPDEMKMHILSMPGRETTSKVERDKNGNISKTTQTERDA